jgi:hypothetical protein
MEGDRGTEVCRLRDANPFNLTGHAADWSARQQNVHSAKCLPVLYEYLTYIRLQDILILTGN